MHFKLPIAALAAVIIAGTVAQDVSSLCTVSPSGCTIGATACPTGCIKSARCKSPCPSQKTTVVTYTSRTTVSATITSTKTSTKTVTATPSVKPPTCAKQVPYINLFTFQEQGCSTLVDADFDLLCLLDEPQVNFTFSGPPNKLNSPTLQTLPSETKYSAGQCVELAVQDSHSAYFTIDGTAGTNATSADCRVVLFSGSDCTGFADSYNIDKANVCQSLPVTDDPWKSAQFECSLVLGPV